MKIKVIIIGGGATGMGVASKLLRSKNKDKFFDIHVYQEQKYISLGACAIPYYIANDFKDANLLTERTKQDYPNNTTNKNKIKIHLTKHVTKIDPVKQEVYITTTKTLTENKTDNSKTSKYHILVIATGAKPKIPPPFNHGTLPNNVYTVNSKEDALNLKKILKSTKKVTIVGGGFIGMEMTETCLKQKKDVTLIELKDRLMADIVDTEFSNLIYNELSGNSKEHFINEKKKPKNAKILLNTKIDELMMTDDNIVTHLRLRDKNNSEKGTTIACDIIILAIGFQPNTAFLEDSNIKLNNNNAIIINEFCQVITKNTITKQFSNIYSGGDCTEIYSQFDNSRQYIPLATNANKMARIIAKNIINPIHKYSGALGSSILRIGTLEIARTGSFSKEDKSKIASVYIEDRDLPKYFSQSRTLYLKLFYHKTSFKLLEAQMAGYNHATLRINALATAIWNKMDVRDLQNLDLVYAPPFSRTSDIIHIASRKVK